MCLCASTCNNGNFVRHLSVVHRAMCLWLLFWRGITRGRAGKEAEVGVSVVVVVFVRVCVPFVLYMAHAEDTQNRT